MEKEFLANLWKWKINVPEKDIHQKKYPTLKEVRRINWSSEFETYMRNRLAFGYFRYGPLTSQKKGEYNNIASMIKRLGLYMETGNDEILVDVANIAMVEYMRGDHPLKHFKSVDDGIHTQKRKKEKYNDS